MNSTLKTLLLWAVIFVMVILLINIFSQGRAERGELSLSQMERHVENGEVADVTIRGDRLTGKFKSSRDQPEADEFFTILPPNYEPYPFLKEHGVEVTAKEQKESPFLTILYAWGPILLIVGLWIFFMRQMQIPAVRSRLDGGG